MLKQIIIVILIPFLTAALFSNTLVAEFLTDYHFSFQAIENTKTSMTVFNKGGFQAHDVLVSFFVNDTAHMIYDNCPEGILSVSDNPQESLIIEIPTMTSRYLCTYHFDGILDISDVSITSNGRMTVQNNEKPAYNPILTEAILVMFFVVYGIMLWYALRLPWANVEDFVTLKISNHKFAPSERNDEIREFVKKEYKTAISDKDAAIIESIFLGKDVKRQITAHTALPLSYVKRRLQKLEEKELIKLEPIELDDTLQEFLEDNHKQ